jgi:ankyrin repeat protein
MARHGALPPSGEHFTGALSLTILQEAGADLYAQDDLGDTALIAAADEGRLEVRVPCACVLATIDSR